MGITIGDVLLNLGLDIGDFKGQLDGINKQTENAAKNMEGHFKSLQDTLKVVGLAMAGVGASGLAIVESSLKINASMGQTAITLGITAAEVRNLVLSVTSVDSPISEVSATFDVLTRAGVRNTEELKNIAGAFDALADATGGTADGVASQLIPAFRALGVELPKNSAELDKFTWLTKNTTVDLGDFSQVVQRLAPEMSNAGISMDDVVIALAALNEKGISGRVATAELGNAIKTASEKGMTLTSALGLTSDQVQIYKDKLAGATGITDKYAEAGNKQFGVMDQLKQTWSEITLQMSAFLTPLEPILAGMSALGPLMAFLGTSTGAATVKWVAHTVAVIAHNVALAAHAVATGVVTAAQFLWNAAMSANPIGIVILAITALIAAVVLIAKNWDTVREKTIEVWNTITTWLKGMWDKIVGFFRDNWALILSILFPAVGLPILIAQNWGGIVGKVKEIWDKVTGTVTDWWDKLTSWITTNMNPWNWIKKGWEEVTSGISGTLDHIFGHSIIEDWTSGLQLYLAGIDLGTPAGSMMKTFIDSIGLGLDTASVRTEEWYQNYNAILARATAAQAAANAELARLQAEARATVQAAVAQTVNSTDMGAAVGQLISSGMTDDQIRANYAGLLPPEAIEALIGQGHQYASRGQTPAQQAAQQQQEAAAVSTFLSSGSSEAAQAAAAIAAAAGAYPGYASGGIIRATPGGRLIRAAEGGEDEIVAPLSQLGKFVPVRGLSGAAGGQAGGSGMQIFIYGPVVRDDIDINVIGEKIANEIRLRTAYRG